MRLTLEVAQLKRFQEELRRAGRREIGGVLVGSHFGDDQFDLVDFSIQRRGGGRAHFNRDPVAAARFVDAVIARMGGDPSRVNYLGEWHSHPAMSASPSITDAHQMQAIVDDPDGVATFGVLIVVSSRPDGLAMSATLFQPAQPAEAVTVTVETPGGRWQQVPSDVWDDEGDQQEDGDATWARSGIASTLRQWWARCCGNV